MSLTITNRPIGHRLNTSDISAVIYDDGTGDARVYVGTGHGLSDGDYVYIESNFDSYNGYKLVDSTSYDYFKIKDNETDYVQFVQEADITYRTSVLNHGWQSVHLPIVYEIVSDLWPNNIAEESYTPTTIVSQADENGNTLLNLSVGISGITALNYIELVGTGDLAGPYQVLQVDNPWAIVINLAYDAANDFTGYQVVNYYNNYCVNVEVWAGLDSGHRWAAKKPYELASTLKFIPDSEGKIKFSIADILKGYVNTRNNLTLDTLPNNLDFHVSFYIKYYESYDDSDGDTIETATGDVTSDTFEGHAVNSMMPFKSLDSGFMSEYVNEGSLLARWLTLFDVPTVFVDRFFDLSFILQYSEFDIVVVIYKSLNGIVTETENLTIENPGLGLIRVPIIPATGFDRYCLQAFINGPATPSAPALASGENVGTGFDWTINASPSATLPGNIVGISQTKDLAYEFNFIDGLTYVFSFNFTRDQSLTLVFATLDGNDDSITTDSNSVSAGTGTSTATFVATSEMKKYSFHFQNLSAGADPDRTVIINFITISVTATNFEITEQICLNVIDDCASSFASDDLRLTEGSEPRIIE